MKKVDWEFLSNKQWDKIVELAVSAVDKPSGFYKIVDTKGNELVRLKVG